MIWSTPTNTNGWCTEMAFFTADQLVAHAVGDYILQSHWMATEKTKNSVAAAIHAVTYTLPFALITQSPAALAVICGTHFLVDRFRLARFVVWLKNGPIYWRPQELASNMNQWRDGPPGSWEWQPITATGYQDNVPAWLSVWLLIAADNIIHVLINAAAIAWVH
jgi:hypothetical protein